MSEIADRTRDVGCFAIRKAGMREFADRPRGVSEIADRTRGRVKLLIAPEVPAGSLIASQA